MITEETPEIQKENEKQKSGGWIAPLIISCAIVLSASALAVGLYLFRSNREHTIIATGSANVDFDSDLAKWGGSIQAYGETPTLAYRILYDDLETVKKFLEDNGVKEDEIKVDVVDVRTSSKNEYDDDGNRLGDVVVGYYLTQYIEVTSNDVDKIEKISQDISVLLGKGVELDSDGCQYFYTKINDLKLNLIRDATENAKERIDIMSEVSGARLGKLKNSSLGVFQITKRNSGTGEYSYDGSFNTSSREKTATVTVRLEYDLK